MKLSVIKNKLDFLINTFFHPQWLLARKADKNISSIVSELTENLLDIGCGEKNIKKYISAKINYIGLDYYATALNWYKTVPDIYGDAVALPFDNNSFMTVLMLDVLEHIPDPKKSIDEVARVLMPNGKFILQVPFIYPIHDAPLDFHRWTKYGLKAFIENSGLKIISIETEGKAIETAGVLINIALCKTLINLINNKSLFAILFLFLPVIIALVNIVSLLISFISPNDDFMPINYKVIAVKKYKN